MPFIPVSIINKSSPKRKSAAETEINAYMWIPLNVLFRIVENRPNKNDYDDIILPDKYIPLGEVPYGKDRDVTPNLRSELAKTLDVLRKTRFAARIYSGTRIHSGL